MILTTTNTENYGREEIHKTLVQMADVAVPANESDVLWRHATFEEAVAYLVAIAVVLETDSKTVVHCIGIPPDSRNGSPHQTICHAHASTA